ncbi:MAG TPA: hypothetical protein VGQ36_13745 [Thermoanaerobaculia bacterium]|jgi:hypothetical protein|nr:hypothetical protein [Thermoanaerobaculia bacterium]
MTELGGAGAIKDSMTHRLACSLFVTLVIASPIAADCPGSSIPHEAILALGDASTVAALDAAFNRIWAMNPGIVALYRHQRLSLNPTWREELRYLRSLPRTRIELQRIYELTYARDVCEHRAVSETIYDMFDTAARLVQRHGRYHREFIELCLLTDGELGEVAWPAFDWLLEEDSARTISTLRSLPPKTRANICDGRDPRQMTDEEAVTVCEAGL